MYSREAYILMVLDQKGGEVFKSISLWDAVK